MAPNVEYVVKARDDSTVVLSNVLRQFQGIDSALGNINSIATGAGKFGLVAGAVAATAGAVFTSAKAIADNVEQLDRMSASTGLSIERLQAMRQIVKENGGNFDDVTHAITTLNRRIADGDPLLERLGIRTRDTFAAFTQVAGILAHSSDVATRTNLSYQLLGKSSVELIRDMSDLASRTDTVRRDMDANGGLIGERAAQQARELDERLNSLGRTWGSVGTSLGKIAVPLASGVGGALDAILKGALAAAKAIRDDLGGALEELAAAKGSVPELTEEQKAQRSHVGRLINGQFVAPSIDTYGIEVKAAPVDPFASVREALRIRALSMPKQRGEPGLERARTRYTDPIEGAEKALARMVTTLQPVPVVATQFGEAGERVNRAMDAASAASKRMQVAISSDVNQAIAQLVRGGQNIRAVFAQLTGSILSDVAEAAAQYGIGLGLSLLSGVPGFGWLAPVGAVVSGVESKSGGGGKKSLAPSGGDTYFISTLNAKDLVQELTSPSGQLRRANDRIRDVAIAARR